MMYRRFFIFIFFVIGTSLGSLVGGIIYEQYGGSVMFRSFGIYSLVFGATFSLLNLVMDYKDSSLLRIERKSHSVTFSFMQLLIFNELVLNMPTISKNLRFLLKVELYLVK